MQWFKHQSNAHNDAKLEKVLMKYGAEGYALYWYCLELIAGKVDGKNITFELEHDAEILGYRLKIDSLRVEEIMNYMISLGLFENSGDKITCLKLASTLDERWTRSEELKEVIKMSSDSLQTVYKPLPLDKNRIDKNRIDNNTTCQKPKALDVPYQSIIDLYHETLPLNPRVARLSSARKAQIKARWKDGIEDLEAWKRYFKYVAKSKFLTGKTEPGYGREIPFVATIDFLIKEANVLKIVEGKYHGKS